MDAADDELHAPRSTSTTQYQYVLTDNGRTTVVTESDHTRQDHLQQQISLGVLGALAVGATFMTGAVLTHHAAPQPTETQSAGRPLA